MQSVSVVVPFADHEEIVSRACQRMADHLAALGQTVEILGVDIGCGDNSRTVLGLSNPTLPILSARPARGFAAGIQVARGRAVVLITPEAALRSLAPLGRALGRVLAGELDLVLIGGHFAVLRRTCALALGDGVAIGSAAAEARLVGRARRHRLRVEHTGAEARGIARFRLALSGLL